MAPNLLKSQAFVLKGRLYTLTVIQLLDNNKKELEKHLDKVIEQAPRLFNHVPVVIDCSGIHDSSLELQEICQSMRERNIFPVAIQGANSVVSSIAQCMGLAVLHASSNHDKSIDIDVSKEKKQPKSSARTKLQTSPVRSGQQLMAKKGDLVVTSSVSHGAELLADGNIHVYGALRGRALAGMSGDKNARIFCMSLEAELVSIAGFYRLSDAIGTPKGPCQIYLQDDHIYIESLC